MERQDFYTIAEVAKQFRVSRRTIERWIQSRDIAVARFGVKIVRIPASEVERLLNAIHATTTSGETTTRGGQ